MSVTCFDRQTLAFPPGDGSVFSDETKHAKRIAVVEVRETYPLTLVA